MKMSKINYVEYTYRCQECGNVLRQFETQDVNLTTDSMFYKPTEVKSFYTRCSCNKLYEFSVVDGHILLQNSANY
jgi:uncharacterized Zn finger protein